MHRAIVRHQFFFFSEKVLMKIFFKLENPTLASKANFSRERETSPALELTLHLPFKLCRLKGLRKYAVKVILVNI
jgi:hypothetical protein